MIKERPMIASDAEEKKIQDTQKINTILTFVEDQCCLSNWSQIERRTAFD
jgi:hypothetical protein